MIKFNKNKGFFITGSTAKYCADVAPERIQFRQYSIILQYICKIQYVLKMFKYRQKSGLVR